MLNNFCSYATLCRAAAYLDLLEAVGPSSKVFEGKGLMIYEVKPSIERTVSELLDQSTYESIEDDITTHLRRFVMTDSVDNPGKPVLSPVFKAPGDEEEESRQPPGDDGGHVISELLKQG